MHTLFLRSLLVALVVSGCRFDLERALLPGELRGQVVFRDQSGNTPLKKARVVLEGTRFEARTDVDGAFVLRQVPVGRYDLRVVYEGVGNEPDAALLVRDVSLQARKLGGAEGRDLGVLVVGGVGAISGRVVHHGEPVPGATLGGLLVGRAVVGNDGVFSLPRLAAGTYHLAVSTPDGGLFSSLSVAVDAGVETKVDVDLGTLSPAVPGTVSGSVMQVGNPDYTGIAVWLERDDERLSLGESDADGRFLSAAPVSAGIWTLVARAPDAASVRLDPVIVAGDTDVGAIYLLRAEELDDIDADGVLNDDDVCPFDYDPGQEDMDGDGVGDACDPDMTGNGIPNDEDLTLVDHTGDPLQGVALQTLDAPFVVQLLDVRMKPLAGQVIAFDAGDSGATLAPTSATTDESGFAETTVTLGGTPKTGTITAKAAFGNTVQRLVRTLEPEPVASRFEILPPAGTIAGGRLETFTLRVVDEDGQPVAGYRGVVWVETTDSSAVISETEHAFTESDAGSWDFGIQFGAPGEYTVSVGEEAENIPVETITVQVTPMP